jgi:DNA-binding NarL/FixJ family response regulator
LLDRGEWDLALDLAGNLSWYWFQRGRVLEGQRWLHRAVGEAPAKADPRSRCRAVFGLGLLAQATGNVASAKDLLEEAAWLANETEDELQLAISTGLLAGALTTLGEFDRAIQLFTENEARWDAERRPTWMAHAYFHLGLIALGRSDTAEAARQFAASIAAYDEGNSPLYAVDALQYLGLVELMNDNSREAARVFDDALNRLELRKSAPDLAMGVANVAALAARMNRPSDAVMMFAAANAARATAGLALPEPAASMYATFRISATTALSEAAASEAVETGERMTLETALEVARAVLAGGEVVLAEVQVQEPGVQFGLTEREFDVLRLLGNGKTNDEIAQALFISNGTARTHVANILGKLDAHTRTEAAGIARRNGLI